MCVCVQRFSTEPSTSLSQKMHPASLLPSASFQTKTDRAALPNNRAVAFASVNDAASLLDATKFKTDRAALPDNGAIDLAFGDDAAVRERLFGCRRRQSHDRGCGKEHHQGTDGELHG